MFRITMESKERSENMNFAEKNFTQRFVENLELIKHSLCFSFFFTSLPFSHIYTEMFVLQRRRICRKEGGTTSCLWQDSQTFCSLILELTHIWSLCLHSSPARSSIIFLHLLARIPITLTSNIISILFNSHIIFFARYQHQNRHFSIPLSLSPSANKRYRFFESESVRKIFSRIFLLIPPLFDPCSVGETLIGRRNANCLVHFSKVHPIVQMDFRKTKFQPFDE